MSKFKNQNKEKLDNLVFGIKIKNSKIHIMIKFRIQNVKILIVTKMIVKNLI